MGSDCSNSLSLHICYFHRKEMLSTVINILKHRCQKVRDPHRESAVRK